MLSDQAYWSNRDRGMDRHVAKRALYLYQHWLKRYYAFLARRA